MTIDALIQKLLELQEEHGNLDVKIWDEDHPWVCAGHAGIQYGDEAFIGISAGGDW